MSAMTASAALWLAAGASTVTAAATVVIAATGLGVWKWLTDRGERPPDGGVGERFMHDAMTDRHIGTRRERRKARRQRRATTTYRQRWQERLRRRDLYRTDKLEERRRKAADETDRCE